MKLTYRQSFYSLIKPYSSDNECHVWDGTKDSFGYGVFRGKRAHRVAWELEISEIPFEKILLHSCDNSSCVNLRHLSIGTHLDNARDKMLKGRHPLHNGKIYPSMIRDYILVERLKEQIKNQRPQRKTQA